MEINKNYIRVSLANNGIDINEVQKVVVNKEIITAFDKNNNPLYTRDLNIGVIECNSYRRTQKLKLMF